MDIIDHIKQLDKKHGNKLYDLYERNKAYDYVLEFYFGNKNEKERVQFDISELYYKQLEGILYHGTIDFDQYFMYIQTLFKYLRSSYLIPNDDAEVNLNNRLTIKKSFKRNEFIFSEASTSQKVKITFIVKFKQLNPKTFIDSQNNTIIELTNITTENLRHNTYWNKLSSRITPYLLGFILLLVVIFSFFTNDIINLTQSLFDNSIYLKILALIFIYCVVIAISPIYRLIEALRKYSKIVLSFKINKKYSKTEFYLNEFDSEKKQNFTIFENLERAVSVPNEDFIGFNLLSASFFYNAIEDSFDPNVNLIRIIDAKRGMGKTSFINLLVQRINGFTYRYDADCQLFKQILANTQIKIVQFSIMPFLATLNNSIDDENRCIDSFITYIADNLTPSSSRYLKAILSSTTAFNDKFNLEKFISQITNSDSIVKIKHHLKLSEQKNLIIIEDLDRLNEKQLKIFVKALWFIYELPFTITLLPAEAEKIKRAVNVPVANNDGYEEHEEYKLLQPTFPLQEYIYKHLAIYTIKLFNCHDNYLRINNHLTQIEQIKNNKIPTEEIENDWVLHMYKNTIEVKTLYKQIDIIDSLKNELSYAFEKFNLSIREFKTIVDKITTNELFIIQTIIFYMMEFRYKNHDDVMNYLNKYYFYDRKSLNKLLKIEQDKFSPNELDGFSDEVTNIASYLQLFPQCNIGYGIITYINLLFGFSIPDAIQRNLSYKNNKIDKSISMFYSEVVRIFFIANRNRQDLYDNLSLNWHDKFEQLEFYNQETLIPTLSSVFILLFNNLASTQELKNIEPIKLYKKLSKKVYKSSGNLFLYQNIAILLLLMIRDNKDDVLVTLNNYFNYKKDDNKGLRIYNKFYNTTASFEIDTMIKYFRVLFNINHNTVEYDTTHKTLQNNYKKLKEKLILSNTDHIYMTVLAKIFKEYFTIKIR